jgi:hypothetical protein
MQDNHKHMLEEDNIKMFRKNLIHLREFNKTHYDKKRAYLLDQLGKPKYTDDAIKRKTISMVQLFKNRNVYTGDVRDFQKGYKESHLKL